MTWWAVWRGPPAWAVVRVIRFGPKVGGILTYECVAREGPYVRGEDMSGKIGDVLYEAGEISSGELVRQGTPVGRAQWQAIALATC